MSETTDVKVGSTEIVHRELQLERAAEKGAVKALAMLGLENDHAAQDVRDLRSLLQALRLAKRTAWQTFIRAITVGVLALLIAGLVLEFKSLTA